MEGVGGLMLFYGSCKGHTVPPGLVIVAHLRANVNSSWGDLEFVPNHSSTFKSQQSSRAEATVHPCRLSGFYPEKKVNGSWKGIGQVFSSYSPEKADFAWTEHYSLNVLRNL